MRGLGVPAALGLRLGAGSGSQLQDDVGDAGGTGRGEEEGTGLQAPVTEWTPKRSPRCHRDGCYCWSRCHSSGGWSSWLPPAASSACSSADHLQHHWGAPACLSIPPEAWSSRRSRHPQAVTAAGEATHVVVGWLPMDMCPSPTWQDPPRGHAFHRAGVLL